MDQVDQYSEQASEPGDLASTIGLESPRADECAMAVAMATSEQSVVGQELSADCSEKQRGALYNFFSFRITGSKISSDRNLLEFLSSQDWIKEYSVQLERGEGGVAHYQGVFHVYPRKRVLWCQLEFRKQYPDLQFPKKDYLEPSRCKAADRYTQKNDTRVRGPWMSEGLKDLTYKVDITLTRWQMWICNNVLNKPPDDRSIYWCWEPCGGLGKTTFQKWIYMNYKNVAVLGGKEADIKNGVVRFKERTGEYPETILINIPKTFNMDYFSPAGVEQVKDMFFFSGKYGGKDEVEPMVCGRPPRVIIFANDTPKDMEALAKDRWVMVRLPNGKAAEISVIKEVNLMDEGPMDEYVEYT